MAISAAAIGAAVAEAATAVGTAVAAAAAALGTLGTALVGSLVSLAVGYVGNALLGSKKPSIGSSAADQANRTQQVRQSVAARRIVLGRVKVSGVLVYLRSNPEGLTDFVSAVAGNVAADYKPNQLLWTALVIAGHPVSAINAMTIDDTPAEADKFTGYAHLEYSLGAPDAVANAMLVQETEGEWTAVHRLCGCAALFGVYKYDQSAFTGVPNPAAIVDGAMPYDPRTGQSVWSPNPALLIAWYLTQDFGLRCAWEEIDQASLIAAANICDEPVAKRDGTAEARYICCGTFDLSESPSSVLDKLKACMDGNAIYSGGLWYIHAGAAVAPSFTITEDMLRGPVTVQANRAAKDSFNAIRATYIRFDADWQATDAPVRYDEAAIATDGGQVFYEDFDFPFTTSGTVVQRLMQIALRRNRAERSVTLQLNMAGLCIRPCDVVSFGTSRLPTANYRITGWILGDMGVDLTLDLEPDGIYDWNPETDELDLGTVVSSTLPGNYSLDTPDFKVATATVPSPASVSVSVTPVLGAIYADVQYRPLGSTIWLQAPYDVFSGVTNPNGLASFRVRARADGQISNWNESDPPAPPTQLSADGAATGGITASWTTAGPRTQLFVGGSGDFGGSALAYDGSGASAAIGSVTAGAAAWVWARTVDTFGNWGSPIGPVQATGSTPGSGTSAGTSNEK